MKIRGDNGRSAFIAWTREMIGARVIGIKASSKVSPEKILV